MLRLSVSFVFALALAAGSLSCSSDSETAGTTAKQATTQTQTETEAQPPPPPPLSTPPGASKRRRVYQELARSRDRGLSDAEVYERVARREGMDVDSVMLIEREGSLRRWAVPAAPKLPPAVVRVRPARNAATRLRSSVRCSANAPRTGVARLRWRPARPAGTRQWVAVTIFLKGFALNSFEASGPLSPRATSFQWRRVHGQAIHYWRVITRDRNGRWLGSVTARFTGPLCIAEFEP